MKTPSLTTEGLYRKQLAFIAVHVIYGVICIKKHWPKLLDFAVAVVDRIKYGKIANHIQLDPGVSCEATRRGECKTLIVNPTNLYPVFGNAQKKGVSADGMMGSVLGPKVVSWVGLLGVRGEIWASGKRDESRDIHDPV